MVDYYLAAIIVTAFAAYAVFGGADFGAGVWEVNNRLRSTADDKRLIYRAIGPVWEANHVWLIFGITAVWTCFPNEFRQLCIVSSLLLAVALVGIVLRGASYAFRSVGQPGRRSWEVVFALASTLTPFCFGCLVGMLSDDGLPRFESIRNLVGEPIGDMDSGPRNALIDWISFPSIFFGFFAVGLCAFIASIFLVREAARTNNIELENRWRKNALLMSWLTGAFSLAGIAVTAVSCPVVWSGILGSAWPLVGLGVLAGLATIQLIALRKYWLASISGSLAVSAVLLAWVIGQLVSGHTFGIAIAHPNPKTENVRWLLLACMVGGMLLIAPPLIWLMSIFKGPSTQPDR